MRVAPKNQRLTLLMLAAAAVLAAILLAMPALRDQASFFYAPSDVARDWIRAGRVVRLGGLVAPHSIDRAPDGVTIQFRLTDGAASVPVRYRGIVPDLFREGSGAITEGRFLASGLFIADTILAKHDANYHPPAVAGDRHKTDTLAR